MFRQLIADNGFHDWMFALIAISASVVTLEMVCRLILRRLARLAVTTTNVIDDLLVDILSTTRLALTGAVGLYVATRFLVLPESLEKLVDRAFLGLVIFQAGIWASRCLEVLLRRRFAPGQEDDAGARAMTRSLLSFLGRVALWALVLLLILDNLGMNVTALVASLGIGGVAVALAVQNILGDLFASLSIAIDQPFVIGDFIVVDENMGTVEHVGLKTTRIRSLSGEQIVFSNNDLLSSRIRNYKRMQERRATFSLGVTYDTPAWRLETIPGLIREVIEAQEDVRFDRAHFKGFGPSSLDFEAVYYVLKPEFNVFMDVQQAINLALFRAFATRNIEFAFPTQTVHLAGDLPMQPLSKLAQPQPV